MILKFNEESKKYFWEAFGIYKSAEFPYEDAEFQRQLFDYVINYKVEGTVQ